MVTEYKIKDFTVKLDAIRGLVLIEYNGTLIKAYEHNPADISEKFDATVARLKEKYGN